MSARLGREKQCLIALLVAALCVILFEFNVEKIISKSTSTKQVLAANDEGTMPNESKVQKLMELATPLPDEEELTTTTTTTTSTTTTTEAETTTSGATTGPDLNSNYSQNINTEILSAKQNLHRISKIRMNRKLWPQK